MKGPSLSQLVRIPKPELLELAEKHGVEIPEGSLDLEVRALVGRALHGGASTLVCQKCSCQLIPSKPSNTNKMAEPLPPAGEKDEKSTIADKKGAANPFEPLQLPPTGEKGEKPKLAEKGNQDAPDPFEPLPSQTAGEKDEKPKPAIDNMKGAADAFEPLPSHDEKPIVDDKEPAPGAKEPLDSVEGTGGTTTVAEQIVAQVPPEPSPSSREESEDPPEEATPSRTAGPASFEWTPAEKRCRPTLKKGNQERKQWGKAELCKCCGLEKQPSFEGAKKSHGAACGYCRAVLIHHGRKHLGLSGAGRLEDFSKEQLAAIKEESTKRRDMAKEEPAKPEEKAAKGRKGKKRKAAPAS